MIQSQLNRDLVLALAQVENSLLLAKEFADEGAEGKDKFSESFGAVAAALAESTASLYMARKHVRDIIVQDSAFGVIPGLEDN